MTDRTATPSPEDAEFLLLDGAIAKNVAIAPELDRQKSVAADTARPIEERLEAYEDIVDSEIGDTDLVRARNIEREMSMRQLFLKFEGGNPSGTQKDRIAFAQAMDALRRGFDTITVATCGNYGVAVAVAAHLAGIRCLIFIPENYKTRRADEMLAQGAEVRRFAGDYESAVEHSRAMAMRDELYDANPGGANIDLQLRAYGEIAYEIYDELRDAPAVVAVPVSNGTTLAGIHRGFVSLYRRGRTSRIPRIVAGSSYGKNPIIVAFAKGLERCAELAPDRIRETPVNEPLVNWRSIDGDQALTAIRSSGGWADNASDKSMLGMARKVRELQGLNSLPASTAGLIALVERHKRQQLPPDRYVAILTGRR